MEISVYIHSRDKRTMINYGLFYEIDINGPPVYAGISPILCFTHGRIKTKAGTWTIACCIGPASFRGRPNIHHPVSGFIYVSTATISCRTAIAHQDFFGEVHRRKTVEAINP